MKRVLAILGSPRKGGNTDILVRKVAEGAASKGAEVESIFLRDLNIKECDGCLCCWHNKPCNKGDDMLDIYQKIIQSDAIIFGTPVYWYGPTALMKAFIDRFVYFNCPDNGAKIKGKKAVIVVPFEEDSSETAKLTEEFFEKSMKYLEMRLVGRIIVGGVGAKGDVLKKPERLDEAYKLGSRLAGEID